MTIWRDLRGAAGSGPGGALRRYRSGDAPSDAQSFVAIVEIIRFASLRRSLGYALSCRLIDTLVERIGRVLRGAEIGRRGRTNIELAFLAKDREDAGQQLAALAAALGERITVEGVSFDLEVAIGAAPVDRIELREEMLDQAAAALFDAQARHLSILFSTDVDESLDEVALMRDLSQAIASDQLELHYQPKLRARTNEIDSAEALLRWVHPVRGPVPTDALIRTAEETGAIRELTDWVMRRALNDQRELARRGWDLTVYVNVSGLLLPDETFARFALSILGEADGRLGIEITETAVIDDPAGALKNLHAFAAAGAKIVIDDYGSGLSSLAYLKQLPANELKIDRMFVSDLVNSHRDPLLVRSSIDLAHALEMEVTAEGVDDAIALSLLRVMGCDLIQGYLIAPPLPLDRLAEFLADEERVTRMTDQARAASAWPTSLGGSARGGNQA